MVLCCFLIVYYLNIIGNKIDQKSISWYWFSILFIWMLIFFFISIQEISNWFYKKDWKKIPEKSIPLTVLYGIYQLSNYLEYNNVSFFWVILPFSCSTFFAIILNVMKFGDRIVNLVDILIYHSLIYLFFILKISQFFDSNILTFLPFDILIISISHSILRCI